MTDAVTTALLRVVRSLDDLRLRLVADAADATAERLLDRMICEHTPSHLFALFSGGHDSLCSTSLAARHPAFSGVVHINTGIGIRETRDFVRETCRSHGWPLLEYHPSRSYDDLVLEHGFPGPAAHSFMYRNLKERAIRDLVRDHKTHRFDRIALVTGARSRESLRRMGHVEPIRRDRCQVWVAPIHAWTRSDCNRYIEQHSLERNLVADLIHMSGECLCGSFATKGEREQIEVWYPEMGQRIRDLEAKAAQAGVPSTWGVPPHRRYSNVTRPLCHGCGG
jgi:3'-phosphoadenosine 5'-phosphosulfate sulfotransferase (PAPS reductase)/FAD synthetase